MATRTETLTENQVSSYKSTWTITYSANDIIVNSDEFTLPSLTVTAKYVHSSKNRGQVDLEYDCSLYPYGLNGLRKFGKPNVSGKTYTIPDDGEDPTTHTISTYDLFNPGNKNQRSIPYQFQLNWIELDSYKDPNSYYNAYYWYNGPWNIFSTPPKITLDVPPTATVSDISFKINNVSTTSIYAGVTYAYVNVQDAVAYYGGDVSSITLTIGSDSTSVNYPNITSNQTLSMLLNTPGTFIPTITITDSRDQTKPYNVKYGTEESIIVRSYTSPSAVISVERTLLNPPGKPYDEGEYTTISMEMTMDDPIVDAVAPTIVVVDENNNIYSAANSNLSVAWYSTRASDGSLSGSVIWANISSGETVYGLVSITGNFDPFITYQISVTPNDTRGSGATVTQSLTTAFYTVDFLAGGHGIAFGKPATDVGFYVDMDTHLLKEVDVALPDYNDSGTTDKAIHDDIISLGWKTDVIPNDTPMSLKKLLAKLLHVPIIIESGSSGIWKYRKWSDGIVECWGVYADEINISTSWGSIYYGSLTGIDNFPITFKYNPTVEISTYASNGNAWHGGNLGSLSTTNCGTILFYSATRQTSITVRASIYAIGTPL